MQIESILKMHVCFALARLEEGTFRIHPRLTAFRWRCDEVEMRGTCLEAQKSIQSKVVYPTLENCTMIQREDTITGYRTKGFLEIRRNEKVLLWT
jgi:hypothetical protein